MDIIGILLAVALCCLPIIGWLVGRFMDADWRCMQLRRFLKKNYIVLNVKEGDGKTYQTFVVNADNDVARVDNYLWIITEGRIYRKDKRSVGSTLTKKNVYWGNQGAPNVFVGKDDLKPKEIGDSDKERSNIKPDEIGATLNAYEMNERAKLLNASKGPDIWTWVKIGLLVIILLLAWNINSTTSETNDMMKKAYPQFTSSAQNAAAAGTVANGSVVINQKPNGAVK